MEVYCDRCQTEIKSRYIDQEKGTAKCKSCNYVFDYRSQLETETDYRRDDIELPGSIKLIRDKKRLVVEYRWLNARLLYLVPFCLCWDAALFLWYKTGFISTDSTPATLYVLLHILLAIGLTYYCIAEFLNRTIISADQQGLQVTDTPLTFFRNRRINREELDQLYAKEKIHRGKKLSWSSFEVHALLKEDTNMRLVAGLKTSEQALYIEQVVEDYLNITDRPVEGEIQR